MKNKRYLAPLILTLINSFALFGINYVAVFMGYYSFIGFSIIYLAEIAVIISFIITSFFKKDLKLINNIFILAYGGLAGVVFLFMTTLASFIDPSASSFVMPTDFPRWLFITLIATYGGGLAVKMVFMIIWRNKWKSLDDTNYLGRCNFELMGMAFISYLIVILIALYVSANAMVDYPDIADSISMFVYVGEIVLMGGTVLVALLCAIFAFTPLPFSKKKGFVQNIKDFVKALSQKNVFFYCGVIFTYIMGIMALNGAATAAQAAEGEETAASVMGSYIALASFYFAMGTIKLVSFWVHSINKAKLSEKHPVAYYRLEHIMVIVVAAALIILSDTFAGALGLMLANQDAKDTPIWWFIIYVVPFALFKLISAIRVKIKSVKHHDNPYLMITAVLSIITALYSILGVTVLLHHFFDNSDVTQTIHIVFQAIVFFTQFAVVLEMVVKAIVALIGKRKYKRIDDPEDHVLVQKEEEKETSNQQQ